MLDTRQTQAVVFVDAAETWQGAQGTHVCPQFLFHTFFQRSVVFPEFSEMPHASVYSLNYMFPDLEAHVPNFGSLSRLARGHEVSVPDILQQTEKYTTTCSRARKL